MTTEPEPQPVKPVSILLVDDDPRNLAALDAVLDTPDRVLVHARSAHDALKALLQDDYALVLLDVQMPETDGFETASLIRQRDRSRDTPIIFLTALDADKEYLAQAYALGAVDYLTKPFEPVILRSKVSVFVELYRKAREIERQSAERAYLEGILVAARTFEHELKTKLASTVGYTQMLLRDSTLPDSLRPKAERALEGAQEAARIISHLIDVTDAKEVDWGNQGTTLDVTKKTQKSGTRRQVPQRT